MKQILILFLITLIHFACERTNVTLDKTWISAYQYIDFYNKESLDRMLQEPSILKFEGSQVSSLKFGFIGTTSSYLPNEESYKIENKKIYLKSDTVIVNSVAKDSMILDLESQNAKIVFRELNKFRQADKKRNYRIY